MTIISGSTTLTTAYIKHLTNMNRASKDVTLGTRLALHEANIASASAIIAGSNIGSATSGSYTLVAGDVSASLVNIPTKLTAPKGFTVQVYRSGSLVTGQNVAISSASLVVKSTLVSGSWVMTSSDVINWVAF